MAWAAFLLLAVVAVGSAVGLVVRKNPLHGALFLVVNLVCVAVLFLRLGAEFLALAQVIVYAGAIMVLFVFAIMLLEPGRAELGPDALAGARRWAWPGAALLGGVLVAAAFWPMGTPGPPVAGGVAVIGRLLFTDYLFPFEITSILLLAALVGALLLTRRRAG